MTDQKTKTQVETLASSRNQRPVKRPIRVYALDPMTVRSLDQSTPEDPEYGFFSGVSVNSLPKELVIEVEDEPTKPGPSNSRMKIVDFDGGKQCFYTPVDLESRDALLQQGLPPSEADPRFHQQMCYAVVSDVLQKFETALGRRLTFKGNKQLTIMPHAFIGTNAYYDPRLVALMFGYFKASSENPGPNIPGQTVFTCLSHDIIAHETSHALLDRVRRYFIEPTNPDVAAFHEGFADIVAIFNHFSFKEILLEVVQSTRGNLRENSPLVSLAEQFGYATGAGKALRTAITKPDVGMYKRFKEPHERGSILVAAVFDAFFQTYQNRIKRIVTVATDGTGVLPSSQLHPDLVVLIAEEAAGAADDILHSCIRALDYTPPVDITFGDFFVLSSLQTKS